MHVTDAWRVVDEGALRLDDQSPAVTRPTSPDGLDDDWQDEIVEVAASEIVPTPVEQRAKIGSAIKQPLQPNETRFIVSRRWYQRWGAAVAEGDGASAAQTVEVGPIDSSDLLAPPRLATSPALEPHLACLSHSFLEILPCAIQPLPNYLLVLLGCNLAPHPPPDARPSNCILHQLFCTNGHTVYCDICTTRKYHPLLKRAESRRAGYGHLLCRTPEHIIAHCPELWRWTGMAHGRDYDRRETGIEKAPVQLNDCLIGRLHKNP